MMTLKEQEKERRGLLCYFGGKCITMNNLNASQMACVYSSNAEDTSAIAFHVEEGQL